MGNHVARLYSGELEGIDARLVEIEADVNVGIHAFNIVGLADKSLNEARERVNVALKNSGVKPPNRDHRKITINLAPADMKKTGSQYDLAIALGYLLATQQVKEFPARTILFLGELALDGRLRPISGALNIAQRAARAGFSSLFIPKQNAEEAAAIKNIKVIAAESLCEVIAILEGRERPARIIPREKKKSRDDIPDLSEICGQENAKRALAIASAGMHNVLFYGPPGVGKSLLARAAAGIMPEMSYEESIEVTKIWSAAGLNDNAIIQDRPFRAPHQTISAAALIGGGQDARPGEISLAHRGILFLDELPEFPRAVLESLRQPLESGAISIARSKKHIVLPARFMLIAAMNPCPCGYRNDPARPCKCSEYEIVKYQKKISGPLLDRIDMRVNVGNVSIELPRAADNNNGKRDIEGANEKLRAKIQKTRLIQLARYRSATDGIDAPKLNADLSSREANEIIKFDERGQAFLRAAKKERLSPRGYYRLLKLARTIADLEGRELVSSDHLAEAFSYRLQDSL